MLLFIYIRKKINNFLSFQIVVTLYSSSSIIYGNRLKSFSVFFPFFNVQSEGFSFFFASTSIQSIIMFNNQFLNCLFLFRDKKKYRLTVMTLSDRVNIYLDSFATLFTYIYYYIKVLFSIVCMMHRINYFITCGL